MAELRVLSVFENRFSIWHLKERFPDIHKVEGVTYVEAGQKIVVDGMAFHCPAVHDGDLEGVGHAIERDDGMWRLLDCDLGCSPSSTWEASAVGLRQPGEDDDDDEPAGRQPRFKSEALTDLLQEEIPPTRWLLTPYVPACSFGELVGPPGKGKTTFMAWMITQMAMAGFRCMIVEEEGSRRGLQRLLGRACAAVSPAAAANISFMHAQHVNLLNTNDIRDLSLVLKGYDFVLFDSYNLVTAGLDEDKAKDVGPVIRDLRYLRDSLQIAVWMNHHSGKAKWRPGEVPRLGDGRGSSALPGALDCELSMRPVEQSEDGFIQFDLFVTKMREADDQIKPQRVSIARNGPAAVLEMHETDRDAAPTVDAHLTLAILDFIAKEGPCSKNRIEGNVKGDSNKIRAALAALRYAGKVEEIQAGNYTKWGVR